MAALKSCMF